MNKKLEGRRATSNNTQGLAVGGSNPGVGPGAQNNAYLN